MKKSFFDLSFIGIFLIFLAFAIILVEGQSIFAETTTTWDEPPKSYVFSETVPKQSDSPIPTPEELNSYKESGALNG